MAVRNTKKINGEATENTPSVREIEKFSNLLAIAIDPSFVAGKDER